MRSLSLALLILLMCSMAIAATPKVEALGPLAGKLDARLIPAARALDDGAGSETQLAGGVRAAFVSVIATPKSGSGMLALEIDVPAVNAQALKDIAATGVNVLYSSARWHSVSAQGSVAQAALLAQLPAVRSVKLAPRAARRATPGQGIAYNQADHTMHADIARNATGLSGAGQKIGVLSDSFNDTAAVGAGTKAAVAAGTNVSGTTPQTTGDLPGSVLVVDFGPGGGTDEGEGMMELIHDIAPNAALAFASGNTNLASYADNVTKLRQAGCTITCDDLFYFNEPCFQDGPVSQSINAGFDAGVPHFSSAGNEASNGILSTYVPANTANSADNGLATPDGQDFHNWGLAGNATPGFMPIDVPNGQSVLAMLQWNQPYASYNLGPGSSVDLDLLLYDAPNAATGHLIAAGGDAQFVNNMPSGDPFEIFQYTNSSGATQRVYMAVNHYAGSRANTVFRIVFLNRWNGLSFPLGGVNDMTIFGHSACAKAISVGAIFWVDIDSGGLFSLDTTHINAERFTSKGGLGAKGIPYFFDATGHALPGAPVRVNKPDITACDGGNTSLFGSPFSVVLGGITYDDPTFPSFFGTSAAAPNAAAVAALMLERAPQSSPAQVNAALQATAHDIVSDTPLSIVGPDDITGAGWIDAANAVGFVPGILFNPSNLTLDPGHDATFSVVATGAPALIYQWRRNGADLPGETGSSLTLKSVMTGDDGALLLCVVSNAYGAVASKAAKLSVNPLPKIMLQPQNQTVNQGTTVLFSVLAANGTLSYQWQRNGADIPGAIFSSYTLVAAGAADIGAQFQCVISNSAGKVVSDAATLSVNLFPRITQQPLSQSVRQGSPALFNVAAVNGTLFYQWQRNGVEIPGATMSGYTLAAAAPVDNGASFQCLVSNNAGSALSDGAVLTVLLAPVIVQQPAAAFVAPGSPVTFTLQAVNGDLKYQWRRFGIDIPGASASSFAIDKAASSDSGGQFSCLVSNAGGSVLSDSALLTVDLPPQIASAPTGVPAQAAVGQPVLFSVAALATLNQPLMFTWDFGDGSKSFSAPQPSATHMYSVAGNYTVTLTIADPLGLSAGASLTEFVFLDTHGDGEPVVDPALDNSLFPDAVLRLKRLTPVDFSVATLSIKLNFAHENADELMLAGTLRLAPGIDLSNQRIQFVAGGFGRAFTLKPNGLSLKSADAAGAFKFELSNGHSAHPSGRYLLTIQKSNLKAFFASAGLADSNATNEKHAVRVSIYFNGVLYDTQRAVIYNARMGKSGIAK